MIQDIRPHSLDIHWHPAVPREGDFLFCFQDSQLLLASDGYPLRGKGGNGSFRYLFSLDGVACWLGEPEKGCFQRISLREARHLPSGLALAAMTAWHLKEWYDQNRFCGHCGTPMAEGKTERSLVCPACKATIYPKIMPAVIIGLWEKDRLLMTRYALSHSKYRGRALIAGFVEIGESAEETVRREVMEEVGLATGEVRYFASQPWGCASDLLLGFFCHLDLDGAIHLDEDELESAEWVCRQDIDEEDDVSLTAAMIRYFKEHPESFPF